MRKVKPKLLFVTDLYYPSKGREYFKEDLFLSSKLKEHFDLVLCNPLFAIRYLKDTDGVLYRNTGPVIYHRDQYIEYRREALQLKTKVFNQLSGKADMIGKQYLVDLYKESYPTIPTIDDTKDLDKLPVNFKKYISKLKDGADSIGVNFLNYKELENFNFSNTLIQPVIEFEYEVSFYYINYEYMYSLYAPDINARWKLEVYTPTVCDLNFAKKFIEWNNISYGIQRVDAIRTKSGELLLMELEDLNPYLSLDCISDSVRDEFVEKLIFSLNEYIDKQ